LECHCALRLWYVDLVVSIEVAVTHCIMSLKTAITVDIRNISQVDLQKVFLNKLKQVQACIDTFGHYFLHLL
jgi:hypothetical protein